jgi:hypothetical protein
LPLLGEKLERLRQRIATDAPDALPVQRERRQVMKEYRDYSGYDPEDLTPEVRAWLGEVDRLRDEHPDVFRPRATRNEQINAKLAAIGEYRATIEDESRMIRWPNLPGLACAWTTFGLVFYIVLRKREADSARLDAACERLLAEWERFRPRFPELEPGLKEYVLGLFRSVAAPQLSEDERTAYEDEQGEITDECILADVTGAKVNLVHHPSGEVELSVHFGARWDEEHGVEVRFGPDGEIERWF